MKKDFENWIFREFIIQFFIFPTLVVSPQTSYVLNNRKLSGTPPKDFYCLRTGEMLTCAYLTLLHTIGKYTPLLVCWKKIPDCFHMLITRIVYWPFSFSFLREPKCELIETFFHFIFSEGLLDEEKKFSFEKETFKPSWDSCNIETIIKIWVISIVWEESK